MPVAVEIREREFRNIYEESIFHILITNNALISRINEQLREFDLSIQQYAVLRILKRSHSANITVIKEQMLDRMSDTSRIVERLDQKGLVTRSNSSEDRRAVQVTITDKGLEMLLLTERTGPAIEGLLRKLSEEEVLQLNQLLGKIRS